MTRFKNKIGKTWTPQPGKYYSQRYLRIMHNLQKNGVIKPASINAFVVIDIDTGDYILANTQVFEMIAQDWMKQIHDSMEVFTTAAQGAASQIKSLVETLNSIDWKIEGITI